ncbi:hypothetical protein PsorP6_013985 [Peronosclerospora sorghi]|uniref:Uncharacterized protein n=1 Tax=Peronosclerospora sorghi TaxID=230839 RepID=A0ACC0VJ23_9STRA|nr:hypothetical protein PsorP6_013985 [Peronosclerospora sorghi]
MQSLHNWLNMQKSLRADTLQTLMPTLPCGYTVEQRVVMPSGCVLLENRGLIESLVFCFHVHNRRAQQGQFLNKRTATNPKKGPIHYRAPSRMLWRTIRGMLPHKTARGAAALQRLKVFDGIPSPYDKQKRMVIPEALRVLRLKACRRYTVLGNLASEVGWRHAELIKRLEAKRVLKSDAYYKKKVAQQKRLAEAEQKVFAENAALKPLLAQYGHAL